MLNIPEHKPLTERVEELMHYIVCHEDYTLNNDEALEIYEGDLQSKIEEVLSKTLSAEYYSTIKPRILPINFMPKMIDKMGQTYSVAPTRSCAGEDKFIENYEGYLDINPEMTLADEYAQLFKGYALEPFINHVGKPSLRSIPYNQFLVKGDDPRDRKRPTVFIKFMGVYEKHEECPKTNKVTTKEVNWYIAYTDSEIMAFDAEKLVLEEYTSETGGKNPLGRIPFVYGNRSKQRLLPTQDTDLVQMIKMFPVLFTDLGGAIMYQCFTIMYGLDVDTSDLKMSPNAFWDIKSDKSTDKKPSVGTINPTAQVEKVLAFISHILGAWAESRSIKIGSIGKMDGDNAASGISKIVDSMDTFEIRRKSIPFFRKEEKDLWELLALYNNHWLSTKEIDTELYPTSVVNVKTVMKNFNIEFDKPKPIENRNDVVDTQIKELDKRLTTRKRAIGKINNDLDETGVDSLIIEIDKEDGDDVDKVIKSIKKEVGNDEEEQES